MINGNELRFNKISIQHFLFKKKTTKNLMHYVIHHQNNTILLTSKCIDWLRNNNHKKLFYKNKIKFFMVSLLWFCGNQVHISQRNVKPAPQRCIGNLCVGGLVCGQHSERGPDGDWTQPV